MKQVIDELFQERMAGLLVGDVFTAGDDDVLSLNVLTVGGLEKSDGGIGVKPNSAGPVTVSASGIDVSLVSTTKKGVAPVLPNDSTKFLDGTGSWSQPTGGPATTVQDETSWGITPAVGNSLNYAREDHTHGSPTEGFTTEDIIIDNSSKGVILKDNQSPSHYWRITVSILGALVTSDLGTSLP